MIEKKCEEHSGLVKSVEINSENIQELKHNISQIRNWIIAGMAAIILQFLCAIITVVVDKL